MRRAVSGALLGAALALSGGCAGDDACKGRSETCVSITLLGSEGVTEADQLQLYLKRTLGPASPNMALGSAQRLPFKIAVLWPDGSGTLSVRSFLSGALSGVTPELAIDLRGGAHARYALTLFPPLPGGDSKDLGRGDMKAPSDLRPPADLRTAEDQRAPEDLAVPPADLAVPPADLSVPADLAMPPMDMLMAAGDLAAPADLAATD